MSARYRLFVTEEEAAASPSLRAKYAEAELRARAEDKRLGLVPFDYKKAKKNPGLIRRSDGEKPAFFGCALQVLNGKVSVDWSDEYHTTLYERQNYDALRLVAPGLDPDRYVK